jgi:hypothetical protein
MISDELPRGTSFWLFLCLIDQDLAEQTRQKGCCCGGRLHSAKYPRRPRGCPDGLPEEYNYRLSFCCDRDGCRKRVTPPSVRFLGRKVYLGVIVILLAAVRQGPDARHISKMSNLVGADRTTIARWLTFWREQVPQMPFWKVARGVLVPTYDELALPRSLLNAFLCCGDLSGCLARLLLFLSPISIAGVRGSSMCAGLNKPAEVAHTRR